MRTTKTIAAAAIVLVAGAAILTWFLLFRESGDPRLAAFVQSRPSVPIVFTSRTEPASLRAASTVGDYSDAALKHNGQPQWQAHEGRLRILSSGGKVRELTWGKPLPDGDTLIDVMSPSITTDGETVIFAGRRANADGGRFRIYAVNVDGSELRQLTGGPGDLGCASVPPLRFAADGRKLSDGARKRIDFDDIDPVLLPNGALVFASSRIPDLGGRNRRATQIWIQEPSKTPRTLTASRANDRWPTITTDYFLLFSVWSKQDEVVAADGTGLVRNDPPSPGLTAPADRWMAARISPSSEQFAIGAKVPAPVWRPRQLFNGNLAFMTTAAGQPIPFTLAYEMPETGPLRIAQTAHGQLASAPSSLAAGTEYPESAEPAIRWAPARTADGRNWSLATPSPMPQDRVVVSASPLSDKALPLGYGLYSLTESGWTSDPNSTGELTPLFDDPDFVDAEPVAVYPRPVEGGPIRVPQAWDANAERKLSLLTGDFTGKAGELHAAQITTPSTGPIPGNIASGSQQSIVPIYPPGTINRIAFYVAHRDRFDDPVQPVVKGGFEKLHEVPVAQNGMIRTVMPVGSPTLLVGLGPDGKVASAVGAADAKGTRGKFYAFAGDHVSGTRPGGYHFCTGCHAGHTFPGTSNPERVKD